MAGQPAPFAREVVGGDGARELDVVVLGAGFAGLCAAIGLKRSGRDSFVVLEKADEVGGTWRHNTYPGVECDVPSHLYSYSFAPNPYWSKTYGTGAEIWAYLRGCVDQFDLSSHLLLGAHATTAEWDGACWVVTTAAGERFRSRFLITGLGGLHTPSIPELPGMSDFGGPVFHTSHWRHDVDLHRKRVAIVGTGATAVQVAPEVAAVAAEFYLLQRSPAWVGPKKDPAYTSEQQSEFAANPNALRRHRWDLWRRWETTGAEIFKAGTSVNHLAEMEALENITANVRDPSLVAKLTPNYNFSCKRPTLSDRYYPMFNRDNVHLVTEPIERFTPTGIVVERNREIPLDVVILATGFKPFNIATEIEIAGVGGVSLADFWDDRITSYRTIMASKFPNMFMLTGPNSAGLTSAVQMIEAGTKFAIKAIAHVEKSNATSMYPKQQFVDEFTRLVDRLTADSTANHGCVSWWTDGGVNHALWPDSSIAYRMMLEEIHPDHFEHLGTP